MSPNVDQAFEASVERIVERVLARRQRDVWHNAQSAAEYLRLSKTHFLRLCRAGRGPEGQGEHRNRRWKEPTLDRWQEGRSDA